MRLCTDFSVSPHPHPPHSLTHSIFKSKDSPCVMQAVSFPPPPSLSLPLSSASPVPQNVWIDVNGVIVTALPAVCNSTSASQRLWKVWREQRERKKGKGRGKERGRKVPLNNKAWRPSRESSLASGVGLFPSPFLFLYLCLCALSFYSPHSPTLSFLECLFPVEHPIFNLLSTVSAPPLSLLSPFHPACPIFSLLL